MAEGTEQPTARAVHRVLDVLETVAKAETGVTLGDIASRTSQPKATAFRYAGALEERGYLVRDEAGAFRLGPEVRTLQVGQLVGLIDQIRPHLMQLRDRFQETCNLGQLDGDRIVYLEIMESPLAMRLAARIGSRSYVHSTALGKAIAAGLSDDRVRAILTSQGMLRMTSRTIINPEAYFAELEQVRQQGYAIDAGENEPDSLCIAVAIPMTEPPLALSISAPATRLGEEDIPVVVETLREVVATLTGASGAGVGHAL